MDRALTLPADAPEASPYAAGGRLPDCPSVRRLLTAVTPALTSTRCDDIFGRFLADNDLFALPVVAPDGTPHFLIDRHTFVEFFGRPYVREVHGRKAIENFLAKPPARYKHRAPIVVDIDTSLDDVARIIIDAGMQHMVSGFVITDLARYAGLGNGHNLLQELTRRKQAELYYLAHYDPLTQLPNRMLFNDRLTQACREAARSSGLVGLLFIDVDRFKQINDSMGHAVGDQLLRGIARRMLACVRDCDTVARLGGDEFAILIDSLPDIAELNILAVRLLEAMARPFDLSGREVTASISIGVAAYPRDDMDVGRLLVKADAAMYDAKRNGRNGFREFRPELVLSGQEPVSMEADLPLALANDQFVLHYQPQICLRTNRIVAAEALVRWNSARGMLTPAAFLPTAERIGLHHEIGLWVLRTACRQSRTWEQAGVTLRLAVNVSVQQFRRPDFVSTVEQVIDETGASPDNIELELTEAAVMHDADNALATLNQLRALGLRLAIDDFGTGFSCLGHLGRLPVHRLKIDQSLIQAVRQDSPNAAVVRAVVSLAGNLALEVVAEGIETFGEFAVVESSRCQFGQGHFFGKSMPADAFRLWWDNWNRSLPAAVASAASG